MRRKSPPVPRGTSARQASAGTPPAAWKKPLTTSLRVPSPPTATMRRNPSPSASAVRVAACIGWSVKACSALSPMARSTSARISGQRRPVAPPALSGLTTRKVRIALVSPTVARHRTGTHRMALKLASGRRGQAWAATAHGPATGRRRALGAAGRGRRRAPVSARLGAPQGRPPGARGARRRAAGGGARRASPGAKRAHGGAERPVDAGPQRPRGGGGDSRAGSPGWESS